MLHKYNETKSITFNTCAASELHSLVKLASATASSRERKHSLSASNFIYRASPVQGPPSSSNVTRSVAETGQGCPRTRYGAPLSRSSVVGNISLANVHPTRVIRVIGREAWERREVDLLAEAFRKECHWTGRDATS